MRSYWKFLLKKGSGHKLWCKSIHNLCERKCILIFVILALTIFSALSCIDYLYNFGG